MLSKKTILITGGTSALGTELVTQACRAGASVWFTYFESTSKADQLIQLGATGLRVDLQKIQEITAFADEFKALSTGRLDILIHNAAAVRDHSLLNLTEKEWDYVMDVNLKAPYFLTKKLLKQMLRSGSKTPEPQRGAKIFFITSRAALQGGFGISNYAASKAGVIALAKSLAQELGSRNVLVNAVNPGFMKSKMTENLSEEVKEMNRLASPIEKFSDPEEVARFILYLCTDQMTQVTGQVFHFESRKI